MTKRINISQLKSKLRQLESKQRQAIAHYNQGVRKYNAGIRNLKSAIDHYNQEVLAYNSRQRLNQQRLQSELRRLQSQQGTRYSVLRTSVSHLCTVYTRMEQSAASRSLTAADNYFLDLAEREAANSVGVVNALLVPELFEETSPLQQSAITDEIAVISEDLDTRWQGALFALNPANPDAARHFCASSREIFSQILDIKAPDNIVFTSLPEAERTERGNATRRSKIEFLLLQKGVLLGEMAEFASEDIGNIIDLFDILNAGTHGPAGRYDVRTLGAIKQRVEDGLIFLSRLAA
jgi:hypothetical protein